jgi:hypothetical protein
VRAPFGSSVICGLSGIPCPKIYLVFFDFMFFVYCAGFMSVLFRK